jgi:sugar lactone lactonase YvrE
LGPGLTIYLLDSYGGDIYRFDATGQLAGEIRGDDDGLSFVDICFDKAGVAYLSDQEEDKVHVKHGDVWAEAGLGGFGAGVGMFIDPAGLAVDQSDRLYVCDMGNSRVQVLDQWGGVTAVWRLSGEGCSPRPKSIAIDRWGNAFITDAGCMCLRILDARGVETFSLAGSGPGLDFTQRPEGLDVLDGKLYVADPVGRAVQVFDIRYEQ